MSSQCRLLPTPAVADGCVGRKISCVSDFVCVCLSLCASKGKRLELPIPNLVDIVHGRPSACTDSGQEFKGQGHGVGLHIAMTAWVF